jgi:hypothetical protein
LYEGQFIMARTSFSGPVASANGFIGTFTGNVVGNVVGDVTGTVTGNVDATAGYIQLRTVTAVQLAAAANAVNTAGKAAGTVVFETTNSYIYIATGATATSTWVLADGTGAVTPS